MVNALALILLPLQVAGQPTRAPAIRDTTVLGRAHAAADSFVRNWTYQWESSQLVQRRMTDAILPPTGVAPNQIGMHRADSIATAWEDEVPLADLRHNLFHCHPDGATAPKSVIIDARERPGQPPQPTRIQVYDGWRRLEEYIIESGIGRRAICPSWFQGGSVAPWDERLNLDASIIEPFQPIVRAAREQLLAHLDSAGGELPTNDWVIGQRVRFAVDQGDLARAAKALVKCAASPWWCDSLRGYVEYARGDPATADSLFVAGLAVIPATERCAWTDLSILLSDADRDRYQHTPCAKRDPLNAVIWWLSDPLYTERGNERRAEHYSRQVQIRLLTGTQFNERWDLRHSAGGRAPLEMIARYGWPSFSFWAGPEEDRSHLETYLHDGSLLHDRFATAEYSAPRFHTVPAWEAFEDPWDATPEDWTLTERAAKVVSPADTLWWPLEHFARRVDGPLVELWEQVATFRRDSTVLFAMASDLDPAALGYAAGTPLSGALVFAASPDSMTMVAQRAVVGTTAVFTASIPSAHRVVGLELRGTDPAGAIARARFGLTPPRSLKAMRPGEIAISPPVFVAARPEGGLPITQPEAALLHMLSTTTFHSDVKRVGVYWETYGIDSDDTVDVAFRYERLGVKPSALRSLGVRLGLESLPDEGNTVTWREPSAEKIVTTLPGRIPIQGRSVSVDISQLDPGDYRFVVSIGRPGKTPMTAERDFKVVRP